MQDSTAVAHAAAGDDEGVRTQFIDRARLIGRTTQMQVRQLRHRRELRAQVHGVGIEALGVSPIYFARFDRHRTVEEYLPVPQLPGVVMQAEQIENFLTAAHGERRDQHVAAIARRLCNDFAELDDGGRTITVQPLAVGGFHQHEICRIEVMRVLQNRRIVLAEIAAEDELARDRTFAAPQLETRRAEDMTGITHADLESRQESAAFVVA